MSMNINWVILDQIHPYEKNPRQNENAVQYVANSIKEFGWKQPIVVDKDGVIIAGHTRYKAAKKLGLEKVPVSTADDLTEEQVKAYRLADNKTGEFAQWDMDLLNQELGDILDLNMDDFGFQNVGDIDFMDFDGDGDGGGSRMAMGNKFRVVLGPAIFDIEDPTRELYEYCRDIDTNKAAAFIANAIMNGEL